MPHLATSLVTFSGVEGNGSVWQATHEEPWLKLNLDIPYSGGWLSLEWDSSLTLPVSRPALRILDSDGEPVAVQPDRLLCAAIHGSGAWIGFIPPVATTILLSPCHGVGAFGFRLTGARWLSAAQAFMTGLRLQPLMALHALGAAVIGRPADFRLLLEEAINARPFSQYVEWKSRHARKPEWTGLDAPSPNPMPRLHIFTREPHSDQSRTDRNALPAGVEIARHRLDPTLLQTPSRILDEILIRMQNAAPDELVLVVPDGSALIEGALPALAVLAARVRGADFIFGDEELEFGSYAATEPVFRTGFDPLWTLKSLSGSSAVAWRIEYLRLLAEDVSQARAPRGEALYRPLMVRTGGTPVVQTLADLVLGTSNTEPIVPSLPDPTTTAVTIVIPTRDRLDLLKPCIESLLPTLPSNADITIVDNDSAEARTLAYFGALQDDPRVRVIHSPGEFNFSRLSNTGARAQSAELLVFLNNDTTVLEKDWLRILAQYAVREDVGAVGAKLLYPSGRVQHGGVTLGMGGYAGHTDIGAVRESAGSLGRLLHDHSVMAVTGACLAVTRDKFEAVGGFDEAHLPVDLNDIDLCLRLHERGWRSVFVAKALCVHHESATRGRRSAEPRYERERAYFLTRWQPLLRQDPFYHPALSLMLSRPSLGA